MGIRGYIGVYGTAVLEPKEGGNMEMKPTKFKATTAVQMRNVLIKNYKAEAVKSMPGMSNPYSSHQRVDARMSGIQATKLMNDLKEEGWTRPSHVNANSDVVAKDGITVYNYGGGEVRIVGPKKAKPTTIPYYD